MDIKIPDSWLRDYLNTKATPSKIGEVLSLCGPSVEKIEKTGNDYIYHIEITTNRIDNMSVYGIAREASAILPRFKIPANFKSVTISSKKYNFVPRVNYLSSVVDPNLCPRFTAVLIKNVSVGTSPDWVVDRLEKSGVRTINSVVDISNYIMLALGQPVHTFDYDKIEGAKMKLRESKKGETITTLDGKDFILPGGDIVIEDGDGRLIDLAGVMGGNLSMVTESTKNVLLFVQTYNPVNIRKTSMGLAQRTIASTIFEKGIDTELVTPAILFGIELFENICKGSAEKEILNIYPKPFKAYTITLSYDEIFKKLGVKISKPDISKILSSLEFETSWKGEALSVTVPSFRGGDVKSSEDVIEEVARVYGYHNLPSVLMDGGLPKEPQDKIFSFEDKLKDTLSGFGGVEVYTLSLVSKEYTESNALKLKNPLGSETEYLRTSLMPSLRAAAKENLSQGVFHLFEMANSYLPKVGDLPEEIEMLAGIFGNSDYREAKGIIEALLLRLHISVEFEASDTKEFSASRSALILSGGKDIGKIGLTDNGFVYYEFAIRNLYALTNKDFKYKEISKYPSQIEDLTFNLPDRTKVGDVSQFIATVDDNIESVSYVGNFSNSYTFNIKFHSDQKTLTDLDVEKVRNKIIVSMRSRFGASLKG